MLLTEDPQSGCQSLRDVETHIRGLKREHSILHISQS